MGSLDDHLGNLMQSSERDDLECMSQIWLPQHLQQNCTLTWFSFPKVSLFPSWPVRSFTWYQDWPTLRAEGFLKSQSH